MGTDSNPTYTWFQTYTFPFISFLVRQWIVWIVLYIGASPEIELRCLKGGDFLPASKCVIIKQNTKIQTISDKDKWADYCLLDRSTWKETLLTFGYPENYLDLKNNQFISALYCQLTVHPAMYAEMGIALLRVGSSWELFQSWFKMQFPIWTE